MEGAPASLAKSVDVDDAHARARARDDDDADARDDDDDADSTNTRANRRADMTLDVECAARSLDVEGRLWSVVHQTTRQTHR